MKVLHLFCLYAVVLIAVPKSSAQEAHYCADKEFAFRYIRCADPTGGACKWHTYDACRIKHYEPPTDNGGGWKVLRWDGGTNFQMPPRERDAPLIDWIRYGHILAPGPSDWQKQVADAVNDWVLICSPTRTIGAVGYKYNGVDEFPANSNNNEAGSLTRVDIVFIKSDLDLKDATHNGAATVLKVNCANGRFRTQSDNVCFGWATGDQDWQNYTHIRVNYTSMFMASNRYFKDWFEDALVKSQSDWIDKTRGYNWISSRFIAYHEAGHLFGLIDQNVRRCPSNVSDNQRHNHKDMVMYGWNDANPKQEWTKDNWKLTVHDKCMFCKMYCVPDHCETKKPKRVELSERVFQILLRHEDGLLLLPKQDLRGKLVEVYDALGRLLLREQVNLQFEEFRMATHDFTKGSYILRVIDEDGRAASRSISF